MDLVTNTKRRATSFGSSEDGTTMVEFAVCIALFLLILFAILDFSRLGYNWVVAEKAMQQAVRLAALRPAVCEGLPLYHSRGTGTVLDYPAGTLCGTDGGICSQVNVSCTLDQTSWDTTGAAGDTADEIWAKLSALLPSGAAMENVRIAYDYDKNLGFVGGPYVPLITASLEGTSNQCGTQILSLPTAGPTERFAFCFEFITPLSALAATAGAENAEDIYADDATTTAGPRLPFPAINVTLPAEDMNQGNRG